MTNIVATNGNDNYWNRRNFVGGNHSRGYNNNGNFMQTGTARANNSGVSIFSNGNNGGNDLVETSGKKKVTCIASDNSTTRMKQTAPNKYQIEEGKLRENFDNGNHDENYNNNAQSTRTNLQRGQKGDTITAGRILQTVKVGNTNETSDGENYNTETYFKGKDGQTIGIGVNTSDDKTAAEAQREFEQIANDFAKNDGNTKSVLDRANELYESKGTKYFDLNHEYPLDKFKKAIYQTDETDQILKDNNGNPIPKDFTKMSPEERKKAAQSIREAAQEFNDNLRIQLNLEPTEKTDLSAEEEALLNDTLKAMVAAEAAIRDIDEGDENTTVVIGDNTNNSANTNKVVIKNNNNSSQSQSSNCNSNTTTQTTGDDTKTKNTTKEAPNETENKPEQQPTEKIEININDVINNADIKKLDELNSYLEEQGITDKSQIADYQKQWQEGKDKQEYEKIINDPNMDWENMSYDTFAEKLSRNQYLTDANKEKLQKIFNDIFNAKNFLENEEDTSQEKKDTDKQKMYDLIKKQPFLDHDATEKDITNFDQTLNSEDYKDLSDSSKIFIKSIWITRIIDE